MHLLKPDTPALRGSVQNEAFCLTLARRCGLDVPAVTTGAGARHYFLLERYDRREADGGWRRLHQKYFCQALGCAPSDKYERKVTGAPGPRLADLFVVVRKRDRGRCRP